MLGQAHDGDSIALDFMEQANFEDFEDIAYWNNQPGIGNDGAVGLSGMLLQHASLEL